MVKASKAFNDKEFLDLIQDVYDSCSICLSLRKSPLYMEIHGAYKCVPDIGQKCISTRWIITGKFKYKRKIMKAHLVACGYEEDSHNLKTDSSTCSRETMLIVLIHLRPCLLPTSIASSSVYCSS